EGACSAHQQVTDFPTYTFTLPWEFSYGARGEKIPATDVSILPGDIGSYRVPNPHVRIIKIQGQGVLAIFDMPGPPAAGEQDGPFYEGQINLQGQYAAGTNPPRPTPVPRDPKCNKAPPPPAREENSPEREMSGSLEAKLSDSQKAAIAAKLKSSS